MTSVNQTSLRIGLLSYRSNPHCGGQGVYIKSLSRALADLGHQIDIISGPPYPILDPDIKLIQLPSLDLYNPDDLFRIPKISELMNPTNLIEWLGISTMGFSEPLTFGMRAYKYLKNKFHKYDIIHDNQSLSYGLWAIKKKIPTIATIHHPITVDLDITVKSEPVLWKKLKHLRWYSFLGMQKRVTKTLPHIITVSECAQNDISKEFRIPKDRFTVISNGINTDLFYPMPEIKRRKNRIIVTNSADTPLKGLYYLLLSVAEISKKTKIRLIVIGTPKKNGRILRLIKKLGIGPFVTFTGRISDEEFVRQYAKATVAVIPSVYEGFGLPAGEAMACGVPVISTTGGALPEVVGDAGILIPPADPAALTNAITEVLNNPDLADQLSEAGYERVQNHLTWNAAARKTVEAYQRAINDYRKV
ncbi:MAG: glycosyltransferase family 4 protein [Desulfobacteraceae bacterium]|nr:glycosyltransferase family 4 protein [Desulfobacteraceae bacterium]MBC2756378.1 glycosyltransferase family 4 protein [Desulfobacteraceae bacterium]